MTVFACTRCWRITHKEDLAVCPKCRMPTRWRALALPDDVPTTPYEVTINDARFLASLKIDAELSKL